MVMVEIIIIIIILFVQQNGKIQRRYIFLVEIETGRRIPIWRTFVFFKPEVVMAQRWIELSRLLLIDFGLLKRATSPNAKSEIVLCGQKKEKTE